MTVSSRTYRPISFDTKPTSPQAKTGGEKATPSAAQAPANEPTKKAAQGSTFRDSFESSSARNMPAARPAAQATANSRKGTLGTTARDTFEVGSTKAPQTKASTSVKGIVLAAAGAASNAKRKGLSGEERAKQEVDVQSVADTKAELNKGQETLTAEVQKKVDDVFAMAEGKKPSPKGVSAKKISDTEAVLVRTDKDGNELERTVAKRDTDVAKLSLDSASYENGVNKRDHVEVLQDGGTRVRHAEYPSDKNEVQDLKRFEDFETSRDPNVSFTDNRLHRDAFGEISSLSEYSQSGGAVKGSETNFSKQHNGNGIDDKLKGPFDFNQDIDRADTYTYSIPVPGTKDANGNEAPPQYQRIQRFSQGDVQATAFNDKELKTETTPDSDIPYGELPPSIEYVEYGEAAGTQPHNREDLNAVRQLHQDSGWEKAFDNNNNLYDAQQVPKRWLVETQKGDTYRSQTFLEGQPNATIFTERQRSGSTVTERYDGMTPDPADPEKLAHVGGNSTRSYAEDGSLRELELHRQDPDGTNLDQHYTSTTQKNSDGSVTQEEATQSTYTDPQGKKSTAEQQDVSRLSNEGVQLLSTKNTVTDPEGRQAVSSVDEKGEKLTLSGPGGKDPRDITDKSQFQGDSDEEKLLLMAGANTAMALKAFVDNGGTKALEVVEAKLTSR
ncbi:hypothetical protein D7V97_22280 [Corallococcus sp. CA053C]|uniref:hypothetical protein n=1 Tax=Corallococcus sp. CA053C TaxID=2316732 RepID=UPI000EA25D09|nr:hypothetical protein [Corallococcus sp. CA053C]RKH06703.1 hypothetical protein D7V97_22280 [Corallococcus sp. CA053C]